MNRTITVAPVRKTVRVNAAPRTPLRRSPQGSAAGGRPRIRSARRRCKDVVIEPRAGGRWYERGQDGSECDWGVVLAWEPPERLLLGWQLDAEFRHNPAAATEVELRFIAESPAVTRVELEHRGLERLGEQAEVLRGKIDAPGGWTGLLERYREAAGA